jgi:hypothetical protein
VAQLVDGWAWIHDNIQRWGRATGGAKGATTDEVIADACNTAQQAIHDIVLEVGIPWAVRNAVINDAGLNLGIDVEFKTRRLLIETDLGLTDVARIYKLWRVDPANATISRPLHHVSMAGPENVDSGQVLANWNEERWVESGEFDGAQHAEQSIEIYNWNTLVPGGLLKIRYWYTPPLIDKTVFYATDVSGNRTTRPVLPRKVWVPICEYAKLVILETTGDDFKAAALWKRWGGTDGISNRLKTVLANFQIGESEYVDSDSMEISGGFT